MRLFSFKHTGPIPGHDDLYKTHIAGRRWTVDLGWWKERRGFLLEAAQECLYGGPKGGPDGAGEWGLGGGYYSAALILDPREWFHLFGHEMIYYDGENHCVQLGPFQVSWLS